MTAELGRRFFHFVFDPAAPGDCRRNDARQLFARCLVAGYRAVSFSEQLAAQLRNFAADVPAAVRVDLFLHEVQHPVAQRAVDGDAVDQPVRRAVEDRIRLELQIEVQIDPEFLDERADDPLEKLVDRQDRKTAVVVQDLRARVHRAPADRLSIEPQIAFQIAHVAARLPLASALSSPTIRCFISSVALFVNVTAKMWRYSCGESITLRMYS